MAGLPSPTIATKPPVYGRISMSSAVLNITSSTGRRGTTAQLVGSTHSGWSLQRIPTGNGITTSTPAARNIASSPTPDSIKR
ncbi:hypothetical protein I553_0769 [Mycobacterium xenopi 4042]|uniref:Uncharacterized protein n=1 Tax=Mycobacterium xenopi 4042 TaxID=1299334 RepID=X7YJB1_MYCXE|nr:hypothetical protein I553_0769 [Mycobacterium xenopi 4042]